MLRGSYSLLLEALFTSGPRPSPAASPAPAGGQAQPGKGRQGQQEEECSAAGPDLELCRRAVEAWQHTLGRSQLEPLTPRACEALAVVRMLGLLEFRAGGLFCANGVLVRSRGASLACCHVQQRQAPSLGAWVPLRQASCAGGGSWWVLGRVLLPSARHVSMQAP